MYDIIQHECRYIYMRPKVTFFYIFVCHHFQRGICICIHCIKWNISSISRHNSKLRQAKSNKSVKKQFFFEYCIQPRLGFHNVFYTLLSYRALLCFILLSKGIFYHLYKGNKKWILLNVYCVWYRRKKCWECMDN